MIKKAKYPKIAAYGKEPQGFGSLYGGNRESNISQEERFENIENIHDGEELFVSETISEISNINDL